MITRSRSCSSNEEDSDTLSLSQKSGDVLSRKSSVASSYFDSQDSLEREEISSKKLKLSATKKKSKSVDECHQKVIIAPDTLLQPSGETTKNTVQTLAIPHPKDTHESSSRLYLLSADHSTLCEVNKCSDEPRSWFIGNTVQTDGCLLMCTPVDPLFLILPVIVKSENYTTIDVLLDYNMNPHAQTLSDLISNDQWLNICDIKVINDAMTVYRYNSEKTMNWLKMKVKTLSSHLKDDGIYVGSGSHISGFIQSKRDTQIPDEEYFHYASGMIGEYLPTDISDSLLTLYPSNINKRKLTKSDSMAENNPEPFHKKSRGLEPTEDYCKPLSKSIKSKSSSKLPAGIKALAKVDKKGMKSLTNFFGKK